MRRKIYAILIALLLSTVTLAGCGDSGSRRDRDRYEDEDDDDDDRSSRRSSSSKKEDDDDDDRSSSKGSSSSKKKDYQNDVDELMVMSEDLYAEFSLVYITGADDYYDLADVLSDAASSVKVKTSEGKQIKSDVQKMAKFYEAIAKCIEREDADGLTDLNDEWSKFVSDFEDHVDEFIDAAEEQGVDEDDLDDLYDAIDAMMNG